MSHKHPMRFGVWNSRTGLYYVTIVSDRGTSGFKWVRSNPELFDTEEEAARVARRIQHQVNGWLRVTLYPENTMDLEGTIIMNGQVYRLSRAGDLECYAIYKDELPTKEDDWGYVDFYCISEWEQHQCRAILGMLLALREVRKMDEPINEPAVWNEKSPSGNSFVHPEESYENDI